jgi:hypothetical protein
LKDQYPSHLPSYRNVMNDETKRKVVICTSISIPVTNN